VRRKLRRDRHSTPTSIDRNSTCRIPINMEDANRTNEIKICSSCGVDLLERDNYCRRCGVRQPRTCDALASGVTTGAVTESGSTANKLINHLTVASTSALSETDTYHKVSGPLVEAVTEGISAHAHSKFHSQLVRRSLSALISIPIWLMIILLSPFDAYFAAKHISSQVALK
jgi:ribosomal protein L40E